MELLDLLGEENIDTKKAIQYLLDSDIIESKTYQKKQRFTCKPTDIDYCNQREHAIDWFFSKVLWSKASSVNNKGIELKKVISSIQCTPLLVYLTIVTEMLTKEDAEIFVCEITEKIESSNEDYNHKNVRFVEKRALIEKIGNMNWAEEIAKKLIGV